MRGHIAAFLCTLGVSALAARAHGLDEKPAQAPPLQINACALLLPAEITQVIGLPVEPGVRHDDGLVPNQSYSSSCIWEVRTPTPAPAEPDKPLGGKSFVILNAMRWPSGSALAHTFLDSFRNASMDGTIPGKPSPRNFGDEALWWGDGLAVCKGDFSFGISVFLPGSGDKLPKGALEERLAPLILRRLGHAPSGRRDRAADEFPQQTGPAGRSRRMPPHITLYSSS
jgi:hypothetical protein